MREKKPQYSLFDYAKGISYEEFDKLQEELEMKKILSGATCDMNLFLKLNKLWKQKYEASYASKNYLYYKHMDNLVVPAQAGNEEAILEILAFTCHNYQPHQIYKKYPMWQGVDENDLTSIIVVSALEAIRRFRFETNEFHNFAGFIKAWVSFELQKAQVESSPIVQKDKAEREKHPIKFTVIEEFEMTTGNKWDVKDPAKNPYEEWEEKEMDDWFVQSLLKLPNRVGEVLVTYYGIRTPADSSRTLEETAEKLGLSVSTVRKKLEEGQRYIYKKYPDLAQKCSK